MNGIKNEHGILNARYGNYDGKKIIFTHYDPVRHMAWGNNIENGKNVPYGRWVDYDAVKWE